MAFRGSKFHRRNDARQDESIFLDADMFDKLSQGPVPAEAVLGSRIYTLEEIRAINFHFCFPFE